MIPRQLDKHNEDTFVYHQISNISYQVIIHSHIIKKKKDIMGQYVFLGEWGLVCVYIYIYIYIIDLKTNTKNDGTMTSSDSLLVSSLIKWGNIKLK